MNKQVSKAALVAGAAVMLPLNCLMASPRNARKTKHSGESIAAKAGSIAAKGILQNLVVEPELDPADQPTGKYLVTIGEGRRLAQMLRVERGEIAETELIPCVIDTINDPHEISLDENVTREDMHPADQFEAFRFQNEVRGLSAEDIAARFGVTARTVQQRLRLGAVSPRLMQAYRDEGLTLDQLMAFGITEDHTRQEAVYDSLSYQREPYHIRRLLTAKQVRADDRRARFVGAETYINAGGHIERDLFTEDGDGYFTDPVLLDQIAVQRLTAIAVGIQNAEGWKWGEGHIDFPYSAAYRRAFPKTRELSEGDAAALATAQSNLMMLSDEWCEVEDLPDEIDARMTELETAIAEFQAKTTGFDPDDVARGGVIVSLTSDGTAKVERGLIRLEDLRPDPQPEPDSEDGDGTDRDDADERRVTPLNVAPPVETEPEDLPLSDTLIRELTAQRTLALRLVMGERPEFALRALAHSLVLQLFYNTSDVACLEIDITNRDVSDFIDGVDDKPTAQAIQSRHDAWHSQMPDEPVDLWPYIMAMEPEDLGGLVAHCVGQIVDAVRYPYDRGYSIRIPADRLATGVSLDMTEHWRPTARSYFGRITKARIVEGIREAVSDEAAERITNLQKQPMAEAAEQLVVGTGWLPAILRTPPAPEPEAPNIDQPDLLGKPETETLPEAAE
ncbi:ParB/RepB/Spo0J family partition protein [Asticcacaulis sp.]|uniref:ParB/RepB/Spo0J family partition protein n=1 Tax=Asticcacaulis sp. TaxID=1872648 RepID=UPI002B6C9452|nr:ParB/RepB/Spo0J family partition protein [Asticcacaulis sp.]HTM81572.1 ParB/RepB/Spo0J family partition protein [Asticcacaulis sp.]